MDGKPMQASGMFGPKNMRPGSYVPRCHTRSPEYRFQSKSSPIGGGVPFSSVRLIPTL